VRGGGNPLPKKPPPKKKKKKTPPQKPAKGEKKKDVEIGGEKGGGGAGDSPACRKNQWQRGRRGGSWLSLLRSEREKRRVREGFLRADTARRKELEFFLPRIGGGEEKLLASCRDKREGVRLALFSQPPGRTRRTVWTSQRGERETPTLFESEREE